MNISASKIYNELYEIHGTTTISKRAVLAQSNQFNDGKIDLKDGPCAGQPKGDVTKATIAAVEDMTKYYVWCTVKEIVKSVGMSLGYLHKILTKQLKQ